MRRLKMIIIMFFALSLSGCIKENKVLEEKSDAVAEYMAGLLLKYDDQYEQSLIPLDVMFEDDADITMASPTPSLITADNNSYVSGMNVDSPIYSLTDVIGNKNFKIDYTGYKLTDVYPEDSESLGFSLSAREGCQFLVANFIAENITKETQKLNLAKDDISYEMDAGNGVIFNPLLTLLENDLKYIDITVGGGKSRKVLLVFEITKDSDISNLNLMISRDGKSNVIKIK